jgi:leucyl/phenylalanyl-tRNA---protein transferase
MRSADSARVRYGSALRSFLGRMVSRGYRLFQERIAIRLFRHPETAVVCAFKSGPAALPQVIDTCLCQAFNALDASPERVIANYCQGMVLFGEHDSDQLVWKTIAERSVITAESAHIPRRLREYMNKREFAVRFNGNFEEVLKATRRDTGTWISAPLADVYRRLYAMGFVDTIEAYLDEELVGGLWGLRIGRSHGLMSMFHRVDRAGAIAFGTLVAMVKDGTIQMIDCGKHNSNFARYGARAIPREAFIELLVRGLSRTSSPTA